MRIAISGASGTGKTTLAKALAEHYGVPMNPVGARSVAFDMGFADPYQVDVAGKRVEFQERLFQAKHIWELDHPHFVTDRSYFDNLTYCGLHMADQMPDGSIERYGKAMGRYEVVFLLDRLNFQNLNDGVRKTSDTYHQVYELLLDGLFTVSQKVLGHVPPPMVLLTSTSASERFHEADRHITALTLANRITST